MEEKILEALTERGYQVNSLEEAQKQLSQREILEILLDYEGIIGYADFIIKAMTTLGFISNVCPLKGYETESLRLFEMLRQHQQLEQVLKSLEETTDSGSLGHVSQATQLLPAQPY